MAVREDGGLFLDLIQTTQSELPARLAEKFTGKTDKVLFLKADERLTYREVLGVMSLCRDGGAEEIGLITDRAQ